MEDVGLTKINMNIKNMEGGCLCGAVRYCVSGSPFATEYCHCGMCQKASGAPVVSWMDFHTNELAYGRKANQLNTSLQSMSRTDFVRNVDHLLVFAIQGILNL